MMYTMIIQVLQFYINSNGFLKQRIPVMNRPICTRDGEDPIDMLNQESPQVGIASERDRTGVVDLNRANPWMTPAVQGKGFLRVCLAGECLAGEHA